MQTKILAITGSNGKTTTKELIYRVLNSTFKTECTKGNLNNHIGVPLTLLRCNPHAEFLVLEMGANHQGEINALCNIAEPDFGMITNIGKAHLEGFGGLEGVKKGKSEMYRHLARKRKSVFVNGDDGVLMDLLPPGMHHIIYNASELVSFSRHSFLSFRFRDKDIHTNLTGKYNLSNIAAAICIGSYFGVPAEAITDSISSYVPANNRSEIVEMHGFTLYKDAYNANPTSMMASLENFIELTKEEYGTVILGDMLELGQDSEKEHIAILKYLKGKKVDVITIGPEFGKLKEAFPANLYFADVETFKQQFDKSDLKGRSVLIKGSRSLGLERIFQ